MALKWEENEEKFLIDNWKILTRKEIKLFLNKTIHQIYEKAKDLGLKIDKRFSKNAKSKRWTKKDIEYLIKYYLLNSIKSLSTGLNRSENSIIEKANSLRIGLQKIFRWTKEEDNLLMKNFSICSKKEIKLLFPNRTGEAIKLRAKFLKLKRKAGSNWSKTELETLKELSNKGFSNNEISINLGRSKISIKNKKRIIFGKSNNFWTADEINILKENYHNTHYKDLLKLLPNRNQRSICVKARNLGLIKNRSTLWSEKELEILIKNYSCKTSDELCLLFVDKTKSQIKNKSKKLKLKKSEEVLSKYFKKKIKYFDKIGCWRRKILKRDNYCCKECGKIDETGITLQAHHIIPDRDKNCDRYDLNNGICLCLSCHIKTYNKEYELIDKFLNLIGENNDFFKRG